MTPQSSFMILATILPPRETELRRLLATMNHKPGVFNPANPLIPFGQFNTLHFARILILDDQTTNDITVYGMARVDFSTYLAILGDCDGPADNFLAEMIEIAGSGLQSILAHCDGFTPNVDLLTWIKAHNVSSAANYVNWIGRTVRQVGEEETLRQAVENFLQENSLRTLQLQQVATRWHSKKFVSHGAACRVGLSLTAPETTPL